MDQHQTDPPPALFVHAQVPEGGTQGPRPRVEGGHPELAADGLAQARREGFALAQHQHQGVAVHEEPELRRGRLGGFLADGQPAGFQAAGVEAGAVAVGLGVAGLQHPLAVAAHGHPVGRIREAEPPGLLAEVGHLHGQNDPFPRGRLHLHRGGGVEAQHVAQDLGARGRGQFQAVLAEGRGLAVLDVVALVREGAGDGPVGHEVRQAVGIHGPQQPGQGYVAGFDAVEPPVALEIHHGLEEEAPVQHFQGEAGPRLQAPLASLQIRDAQDDPVRRLGQHLELPLQLPELHLDHVLALAQPLEDHADGLGLVLVEVAGCHAALSGPGRQTQASPRMPRTAV